MKKRKILKSAVSGRFVSKVEAAANPRENYETTARPRLIKGPASGAPAGQKAKGPATGKK